MLTVLGIVFSIMCAIEFFVILIAVSNHQSKWATISLPVFLFVAWLIGSVDFHAFGFWLKVHWWQVAIGYAIGALIGSSNELIHMVNDNFLVLMKIRSLWLKGEHKEVVDPDVLEGVKELPTKELKVAWTKYLYGDPNGKTIGGTCTAYSYNIDWNDESLYSGGRNAVYQKRNSFYLQDGDKVAAYFATMPRIRDHVGDIASWAAWWWAHLIARFFSAFILQLWTNFVKMFRSLYEVVISMAYKKISRDIAYETEIDEIS
jgi:hypothetical protein